MAMISEQLKLKFHLIETSAFQEWQKASPKKKEKICEKIGRWEAREIIEEIRCQSKKLIASARHADTGT
jgi:hypothetical protein